MQINSKSQDSLISLLNKLMSCVDLFLHIDLENKQNKGIWWMPWHKEPMKDVTGCDKPRGAANKLWSEDFRMGEPAFF